MTLYTKFSDARKSEICEPRPPKPPKPPKVDPGGSVSGDPPNQQAETVGGLGGLGGPEAHTRVFYADPGDWRDQYEERAAIHEHDGGYSRAEAEWLAWRELEHRWNMEHGERVLRDTCAGCRRMIGEGRALDLIDGNRVHFADDNECLIRHGDRWRAAAHRSLVAIGLTPPQRDASS